MVEEEIRELEVTLATSAGRASAEELDQLVSDDFREFGMSGQILGKKDAVLALLNAPPPAVSKPGPPFVDFRAVEVAPGVVLATYRTPRSMRSSIWRREGGVWRLYFHQGTQAPGRDGAA